jgi:AraC-like DNA-binding protein
MIQGSYKESGEGEKSADWDMQAVYKAREIIVNNINRHFPIAQLSVLVSLNQFKLKKLFKSEFGVGLFEYFMNERMRKAEDLVLHSNLLIKEISSQMGYSRITHFIVAYRKYFGYPPGSVRRK